MRILTADDDPIMRARLCRYLQKNGHTVETCCDGLSAIDKFFSYEDPPELLITDWMMPNLDGIELAKRVRQAKNNNYTYIILLTSKSETEDLVDGFTDGGVDDYIVKPFSFEELQVRINVGERIVRFEREHQEYSRSLEGVVQRQTQLLRKTKDELIERLLSALEFRDQETGSHVRRIGLTSALLGNHLGWDSTSLDDLRVAASMHDIGKVGIPDDILKKPGRLTSEEYEIIKEHTVIGASILAGSQFEVISMAHDIALRHHEKWDGSGYPGGLIGTAIPVSARIVSIVDVFDALANDRIYRPALSREQVLDIMLEGRERHFDPNILDLFFSLLPDIFRIQAENQ
ncbi:HD domain-containing phosphohydrolase [Solidesulfovibrio magneticus]|uniref:Response regulator receiver protein n=1 Tax=Solidesulfovibrio magneticus (strain ATCC 700980 / DSM 13731 / RS-1) TaxID=573370 RepID=C4XM27_SOLM1|nr:HD domain-containing phosphohydrolase [Solidesulfovibrio magneticus]BAH77155.1 response regulator receiver protein [Solidesulfovibrio magneticus RS-1]